MPRLALATAFFAALLAGSAAAAPRPPNIVFILADDLGYGEVGAYGQEKMKTPNIDRLAAEGLRFTDAYAGAPICSPSRLSLMLGRHVGHLRANTNLARGSDLVKEDVTLAALLKGAGYRTALIGKWGIGYTPGENLPGDKGFDFWLGYPDNMTAHDYFPTSLWRDGERFDLPKNVGGMHGTYSNDLFTDEALAYLAEPGEAPFFLYLPYTIPHAALQAPREAVKARLGRYPETAWEGELGEDFFAPYYPDPVLAPNATRAAMIERLDSYVGRILAALAQQGLERETLVIFTSDNGPTHEGGSDLTVFRSAGPFRGEKLDLHEGGIREPMIARWTGTIAAGRESAVPVAFWDFVPTFAELAGVAPLPNDGVSLAALLRGTQSGLPARDLYWEFGGRGPDGEPRVQQAVRRGDLKALRLSAGAPVAIFDLARDPGETRDLSAEHPELVAELRGVMDGYLSARAP